ncbi:MAG: hypothetical protein ACMXYK_01815 [Candidatus Woesearchaeota archaeon]
MDPLEQNTIRAFRKVKEDIIALQREIIAISREQEKILKMLSVKKAPVATKKTVTKKKTEKEVFVASKNGTKYFVPGSLGAQRINKENQIVFKSKEEALKAGYKPAKN